MLSERNPGATCISAQKLFAISPAPISRIDRDRDLRHGQPAAQPRIEMPPATRLLCFSDSPALTRRVPNKRTQSEENSSRQRNHRGEHQHSRVHRDARGTRQVGRQMRRQGGNRSQRDEKARGPADAGQQQALRQKLLRQPPAACAERDPNRHLSSGAPPPGSAAGWRHWRRRSAAPVRPRQEASAAPREQFAVTCSASGTAAIPLSRLSSGYSRARFAAMTSSSAWACASVHAGLRAARSPATDACRAAVSGDRARAEPKCRPGCAPENPPRCSRTENPPAAHRRPCSCCRSA